MASLLKTVFGTQSTETDETKTDEPTQNETDNTTNAEPVDESNDTNSAPQPPLSTPPALKKNISTIAVTKKKTSNDIMIKLRNILDGVASQEADLKRKAHKIEEWHSMHREALDLAAKTKQKLIEFEAISDIDDEETKTIKTKNKSAINSNLDLLEKQLKKIQNCEKKYRSRQCMEELNECNETIKKIQTKHKLLTTKCNQQMSDLDSLKKEKFENESKIKNLCETNKKNLENQKKEMMTKHKDYIHNLQLQHDVFLKKQREESIKNTNAKIQKLENEILKTKQAHFEELELKMNALCNEKDAKIKNLQTEYNAIDDKLVLAQVKISEFEQCEIAHTELMKTWQNEKEKKNEKIAEIMEKMQSMDDEIEQLKKENNSLQETAAFASIQITQKDEKFNELKTKFDDLMLGMEQNGKDKKLLEAKLKVSIKEIIKLRQDTKEKDENKSLLLTQMSNLEKTKNEKIELLNEEIEALKNQILKINKENLHKFALLNESLNDTHSKLESFSVTIKNFSGRELLRESYDTELEARTKSNKELSAWLDNIRLHTQKATEQMSMNEGDEKTNGILKESETQIAHIRLTGLQLLENYTSALLSYNNLYIDQRKKQMNQVQKRKNSKFRNILKK